MPSQPPAPTASPAPPPRFGFAAAAVAALFVFGVAFPGPPFAIQPGVDPSWIYAINQAAASGMHFGSEILFTYGPLGFLLWSQDVGANLAGGLTFKLALAALTALLAALTVRHANGVAGALLFLAGMALTLGFAAQLRPYAGPSQELIVLLPVLLSVWLAWRGIHPRPLTGLAVFLAAVAILIKLSLAFTCATVLALYAGVELARGRAGWRHALAASAVYAATVATLFAATGRLADLPAYLVHSAQMASAYTSGMATEGPLRDLLLALSSLPLLAAACAAASAADRRLRGPALSLLAILLIALKLGFTRQDDPHTSAYWLVFTALLTMLAAFAGRGRALVVAGFVVAAANLVAALPAPLDVGSFLASAGVRRAVTWADGRGLRAEKSAQSSRLLARRRLPAEVRQSLLRGSVDVVPFDVTDVVANDLEWNPRPVFQSYAVLHPAIDALNAAHFSGVSAPDFVLYEFKAIDGRHPFFAAPAAMRALFCNYGVAKQSGRRLVLRRGAARCGGWAGEPRRRSVPWEAEIDLPAEQSGLHLAIDTTYTWWGWLRRVLLRAPEVWLVARYADGGVASYRIVPALAREGLWIGNLPRDLAGVRGLLTGNPPAALRSLRLATNSRPSYRPTVALRFTRLRTSFAAR